MAALESKAADLPPAINDLLAWGEQNGATLNPNAEVYVSPTFGLSLRVKEPTPENGTAGLSPHSTIVSAPYTISLSYMNAHDAFSTLSARSPRFPQKFLNEVPAKVIGCYFLMQQYLLGDKSFWAPYIRSLPQPNEPQKLATPLYWNDEARAWLNGTNLLMAVRQREEMWREELDHAAKVFWNGCLEMMYARELWKPASELYGDLYSSGKNEKLLNLYKWACTIFSSRSFVSTLIPPEIYGAKLDEKVKEGRAETWRQFIKKEGPYPVLFPLVDIANHDPKARVEWFADAKSEVNAVSIKNDEGIKAGEQIFNNYAPKGNSELLLGYGFMLPENDDFAIEMRGTDPERMAQLNLGSAQAAANGRIMFHIKTKPYPNHANKTLPEDLQIFEPGLLNMLSDLVMNEREHAEKEKISKLLGEGTYKEIVNSTSAGRNFAAVLALMKKRLEILLEKLVRTPSGMKPKPGRTEVDAQFVKMAQLYRQGQLKVLVNAIGVLQQRLKAMICEDTAEVFKKEEWPEDPCLTLSTAYKFLAEIRPDIYGWLRAIVCGSSNLPHGIAFEKTPANHPPPSWIDDVLQFSAEHELNPGEDLPIQREVLWALWVAVILHIDENITQKSDFWPDNLANWVQEMLEAYQIRPLPQDDDLSHRVLYGHTAHLVRSNEFELIPRRKKMMYWNLKKPKLPMDENDPQEEAIQDMLEDYWQKLAIVALKIVRGETFLGMGTLGRMIKDKDGKEREVLVKREDSVLFIRSDPEEDEE